MISLNEAFEKIEIFGNINPKTMEYLKGFSNLKKYKEKEHIFMDKDEVINIYIIVRGKASLYKLSNFGDKKVIFIFDKGKILNEHSLQDIKVSINCEVLEDSVILSIPSKVLIKAMENDFSLSKYMLNLMSLNIRRLYRQLQNTTADFKCEKKLASKLLKLAKDNGIACKNIVKINIPLTVTYLSEMIGARRETVSRQINKLSKLNLIEFKGNNIFIKDIDKLRDYFYDM
ncbi:Crp/Fnr family transcriptional regulator [Brachyspira catarrhinii]|uniref:Crp/Fnr family transcriptional regulator n=1 Tax=Brachyspira catarrhinii TaxID=2528966 RepID=A0ABY2TSE6_9SPIR|nr:Crp/Fnr family transcriptional regulator [Brachyspira catarrhinii]TKZ35363.1 Crp/Fnr family transcriptional regulator [Brachyspira catarrhinii]